MPQHKDERTRMMPWSEEELLYCAGFYLYYHCLNGDIADVYLPGRRRAHVSDLGAWALREGKSFCLPVKVRGRRGVNYLGRGGD